MGPLDVGFNPMRANLGIREQMEALAELASIDSNARAYVLELQALPKEIGDLKAQVTRLKAMLESEKAQLGELETTFNTLSQSVAERNQRIAAAKSKMAKAQNAKEADAADKELEQLRRAVKDIESEQTDLLSNMESLKSRVETHTKEFSEFESMVDAEVKTREEKAQRIRQEHEQVLAGRSEVTARIEPAIVKRYETVKAKRDGVGYAVVRKGTCSACRMAVPPQQYNKMLRMESIEQCPHCMRLLGLEPQGQLAG